MRLLSAFWLFATLGVSPDEYRSRRAQLRQALPDALIVLAGTAELPRDPRQPFLQEANFSYLTGWGQPGALLLMAADRDILFLPPRNELKERFDGRRAAPDDPDIQRLTGFDAVLSTDVWEAEVRRRARQTAQVYGLPGHEALPRVIPDVRVQDATTALAKLRMVKSREEVRLIERSIQVTLEAHRESWRRIRPGAFEFQIAAGMLHRVLEEGCERLAYRPVVGSGRSGITLHYSENQGRLTRGDLVLMDVGAECAGYAADITRTLPVSGRFTPRQRELYQVVLGAQKAALEQVKPGAMLTHRGAIERAARDYLDRHGPVIDGKRLSEYFTHGIGHPVGLEVHDAWLPTAALAAGMVITIEPGIYVPRESLAIRIEDMVLVTENGGQLLSGGLPREAAEIERRMAR